MWPQKINTSQQSDKSDKDDAANKHKNNQILRGNVVMAEVRDWMCRQRIRAEKGRHVYNLPLIESINPKRFTLIVKSKNI